jgi:hypothetical protein
VFDWSISDVALLAEVFRGDGSWVFGCNLEMRTQSSQWITPTSPTLTEAHQSRLHVKVTLIAFFDMEEIVRSEFVPQGQIVNSAIYKEVLQHWMLHNYSAPCHTSLSICQFLMGKNSPMLPQPAHSPDLLPHKF